MSWLARSIANSLRIDGGDGEHDHDHEEEEEIDDVEVTNPNPPHSDQNQQFEERRSEDLEREEGDDDGDRSDNQGRGGVKEDLSEFRETLTRQLWGVASFLAPPSATDSTRPESPGQSCSGDVSGEDEETYAVGVSGNCNGLSDRLDDNSGVSNYLTVGSEDQIEEAVGITDEVLAFASNIAHHPETWLDFPLSEDEDMDDFDMSDAQLEHVLAVERITPRLAALRYELCPAHMSEGYFWKVYFVLLHSRLDKHDAAHLSTPQSVTARTMWIKELQKRTKPEPDWFGRNTSYTKDRDYSWHDDYDHASSDDGPSGNTSARTFGSESRSYFATEFDTTEKHPVASTEIQIIDKSIIEEEPTIKAEDKDIIAGPSYKLPVLSYEDDEDDWLKENSDLDGYSVTFEGNNEDVSFSDLEDDADFSGITQSKIGSKVIDSSTKTS